MLWLPLSLLALRTAFPGSSAFSTFSESRALAPFTTWDAVTGHFLAVTNGLPSAGADLKERERMTAEEVGFFVQRLRGLMSEIGESETGVEGWGPLPAPPLPGAIPSLKRVFFLF